MIVTTCSLWRYCWHETLFSAAWHPREDQDVTRSEPQDGGPAAGALLHLHPFRASLPPGDASQGGDVQVETQAWPGHRLLWWEGQGDARLPGGGTLFKRDLRLGSPGRSRLRLTSPCGMWVLAQVGKDLGLWSSCTKSYCFVQCTVHYLSFLCFVVGSLFSAGCLDWWLQTFSSVCCLSGIFISRPPQPDNNLINCHPAGKIPTSKIQTFFVISQFISFVQGVYFIVQSKAVYKFFSNTTPDWLKTAIAVLTIKKNSERCFILKNDIFSKFFIHFA